MTDENMQELEQEELDNNEEVDYEVEASEMGWVSEEKYKGPKEKWVDAKTFVQKGEHILPIMRANNERLKKDLLTRDQEIAKLRESVDGANKAIKALQKHYTEATKQEVENARKELRAQLKQAREVGDIDAELELQDKIDDLKETTKEVKAEVVEEGKPDTNKLNPEFVAWNNENKWFGDMSTPETRKRTRAMMRISEDLREDGDTTVGRPFMDKCMALLEKQEKGVTGRTVSKVEGGSTGVRQGTGGRLFEGLSKEAKATCHEDNDTFVGPGKMFKTVKEWEDHFAKLYSED